jgi:hypothetical protein
MDHAPNTLQAKCKLHVYPVEIKADAAKKAVLVKKITVVAKLAKKEKSA